MCAGLEVVKKLRGYVDVHVSLREYMAIKIAALFLPLPPLSSLPGILSDNYIFDFRRWIDSSATTHRFGSFRMQIPLAFASKPGIVGAWRETSSKVCCTSRENYISRNKLHNEQLFREKYAYAYFWIKFTLREIRIYTHFATFHIGIEAALSRIYTRALNNFLPPFRVILFNPI